MAQTIAIDGPVAVGKSSVGKSLAARLGYNFVDTGAMYRALTWKALQLGIDPNDERKVPELAGRMQLEIAPDSASTSGYRVLLDGRDVTSDIRAPAVEAAVSFVSRIPEVRRKLVARQREMAGRGKVVMVGRDIGTIVLPGADLKVFLTASPEQRAVRRYKELEQSGKVVDCESVLRELKARDTIDSTREDSPLKPAPDARTIDTSDLSLEQVVDRVYELARNAKCSSKRLPTE
ncbi:MAG: (d)CMP kinase [Chloroflexi bacterium]|nr:(d)CMP kinase [Chloroflexota bacterium]